MTQTGAPSGDASDLRSTGRAKKGKRQVPFRPYLYLAPAAAFLALVFVYPFVEIVQTSLQVPSATGTPTFGTENYRYLLGDQVLRQAVVHNLILLLAVPIMTVLALLFSLILFDQIRGWKVYRTLIFTPYILAVPVVGTTFIYLYSTGGIVNEILRSVGAGFLAQDWLGNPKLVLPSIMSVIIYRELGFGVVLFLARMMSIPGELLEAAKLDGANWYKMHRHVTVPQLRSVIQFFVVVEIMTMLSWVFAYVYTMTGGGPGFASVIMEFYIWQNAFEFQSPAIASALAVLLLAAVSGLIFLQHRLRRRSESVDDV
ncbi:MAG: sugar ABC transporter permease [Actinomycetota bacterium]|nr:sugar ABC transporter permease [Actinomycetota bacterium]